MCNEAIRGKRKKEIFVTTVIENVLRLMSDIKPQIQKAQQTLRINGRRRRRRRRGKDT
jgi:hypothetical protein